MSVRTGGVALLALGMLSAMGCSRAVLKSPWRTGEIAIDGVSADWSGEWFALADGRVTASVVNDGEFLYVALAPGDAAAKMQIMRHGLTLWFDPAGGKAKTFGIRYPIGMPPREGRPPEGEHREEFQNETRKQFEATLGDLEILGPEGSQPRKLTLAEAKGIEAKAALTEDQLVCELKIPLARGAERPFAIGLAPGGDLGLGIVVAGMEKGSHGPREGGPPEGGRGGPPEGGRGGPPGGGERGGRHGGGGPGGPRGEGGPRGGFTTPGPIDSWTKVRLTAGS
jgi:hypothetical protein